MFLIDDVLLAPGKAAYLLFQELARKAQDEWLNDDTIKQDLQELYGMLEAGRISEKDFEERECRLLERLEQIARVKFQDKWGAPEAAAEGAIAALPTVSPPIELPVAAPLAPPLPPPPLPPPPRPPAPPPLPVAPLVAALARPMVPLVVTPPAPAPPPAPSHVPPPSGAPLSIGQVMDCAVKALAMLKMRVSTITSVVPDEANWKVSVELVERRGIPDTNDVLGLYEMWLDGAGNVLRYERTHMRRRCDFSR